MRRTVPLASLAAVLAACDAAPPAALGVVCAAPARRASFSRDSAVALCLFPGYELRGGSGHLWARGAPGDSAYAHLSVFVLDSAQAAEEWGTPPRPRSFREPDPPQRLHARKADSVVVHRELIDGRAVEVETALVTGGYTGRRRAALRAAWHLGGGRWALAQGEAEAAPTLDTLRAMLRTARLAPAAPASRRGAT